MTSPRETNELVIKEVADEVTKQLQRYVAPAAKLAAKLLGLQPPLNEFVPEIVVNVMDSIKRNDHEAAVQRLKVATTVDAILEKQGRARISKQRARLILESLSKTAVANRISEQVQLVCCAALNGREESLAQPADMALASWVQDSRIEELRVIESHFLRPLFESTEVKFPYSWEIGDAYPFKAHVDELIKHFSDNHPWCTHRDLHTDYVQFLVKHQGYRIDAANRFATDGKPHEGLPNDMAFRLFGAFDLERQLQTFETKEDA